MQNFECFDEHSCAHSDTIQGIFNCLPNEAYLGCISPKNITDVWVGRMQSKSNSSLTQVALIVLCVCQSKQPINVMEVTFRMPGMEWCIRVHQSRQRARTIVRTICRLARTLQPCNRLSILWKKIQARIFIRRDSNKLCRVLVTRSTFFLCPRQHFRVSTRFQKQQLVQPCRQESEILSITIGHFGANVAALFPHCAAVLTLSMNPIHSWTLSIHEWIGVFTYDDYKWSYSNKTHTACSEASELRPLTNFANKRQK